VGRARVDAASQSCVVSLVFFSGRAAGRQAQADDGSSDALVEDGVLEELREIVVQSGVSFCAGDDGNGWSGGSLWLVPTFKAVEEWAPIAVRKL
jgi:hypothetical protein